MTTQSDSTAIRAKILAALTDEWQRASAICIAIHGPKPEYGAQGTLYYQFKKMVEAKLIEHYNRRGGGGEGARRINFYRLLQCQ